MSLPLCSYQCRRIENIRLLTAQPRPLRNEERHDFFEHTSQAGHRRRTGRRTCSLLRRRSLSPSASHLHRFRSMCSPSARLRATSGPPATGPTAPTAATTGSPASGFSLPPSASSGPPLTGALRAVVYGFHEGYWGPHVGFYGGINYGFGYLRRRLRRRPLGRQSLLLQQRRQQLRRSPRHQRLREPQRHQHRGRQPRQLQRRPAATRHAPPRRSSSSRMRTTSRPLRPQQQHFQTAAATRPSTLQRQRRTSRHARCGNPGSLPPAGAQPADGFGHANEVNTRQGNQQQRINQGVRSGQMTPARPATWRTATPASTARRRPTAQPTAAPHPAGASADQPASEQRQQLHQPRTSTTPTTMQPPPPATAAPRSRSISRPSRWSATTPPVRRRTILRRDPNSSAPLRTRPRNTPKAAANRLAKPIATRRPKPTSFGRFLFASKLVPMSSDLHEQIQDRIVVVLVRARNPSNIGAVARAMHDLGFAHLRVVNEFPVPFEAAKSAVDASSVLAAATSPASVAEAIADCTFVLGTTAVGDRVLEHPLHTLPEAIQTLHAHLASQPAARIALLFGSEKTGLSNDELSHCHALLTIPMNTGNTGPPSLHEPRPGRRRLPLRPRATHNPRVPHSSQSHRDEWGSTEPKAPAADLERFTTLLHEVLRPAATPAVIPPTPARPSSAASSAAWLSPPTTPRSGPASSASSSTRSPPRTRPLPKYPLPTAPQSSQNCKLAPPTHRRIAAGESIHASA